jgi:hypothetical protein
MAGSTAKVPVAVSVPVEDYAFVSRSLLANTPVPGSSLKLVEIGRKRLPVGWFARNFTLSSGTQANVLR